MNRKLLQVTYRPDTGHTKVCEQLRRAHLSVVSVQSSRDVYLLKYDRGVNSAG